MPRLPPPCPHLSSSTGDLRRLLHHLLPTTLHRHCHLCPSPSPHLLSCLSCPTLHCPSHFLSHSHSHPDHLISIDVHRLELFCSACNDQVYHPHLDHQLLLTLLSPIPNNGSSNKRQKLSFRPDPTTSTVSATTIFANSPLGLRGLNNLGNTCFMNAVLQALLHTPLLRNYFLSDRHNRGKCGLKVCLACDLDGLYSAVFCGDRKPYSPAGFLYSWWQHASNLASYEQHDAHDFFISMLDGLHEKEQDERKRQNQGNGDCCIAHRVFSGILRSDVTCTSCGFTSTTYDPCVDFSLDLHTSLDSARIATLKSHASNGKTESKPSIQISEISTLTGSLQRFTRPERLGSDQKFFCQHCKVRQEFLKQMSIRKLPLVTCFHIKRFEHSSMKKLSRKIDRYLQFPFSLDMSPYLASSILRSRYGNRLVAVDGDDVNAPAEIASEFELYAVVTHSGRLEAGHYTTYLRLNNQWYKCDDARISHVTESMVRASQAYMLFYVQKILYYKATESAVNS